MKLELGDWKLYFCIFSPEEILPDITCAKELYTSEQKDSEKRPKYISQITK